MGLSGALRINPWQCPRHPSALAEDSPLSGWAFPLGKRLKATRDLLSCGSALQQQGSGSILLEPTLSRCSVPPLRSRMVWRKCLYFEFATELAAPLKNSCTRRVQPGGCRSSRFPCRHLLGQHAAFLGMLAAKAAPTKKVPCGSVHIPERTGNRSSKVSTPSLPPDIRHLPQQK